MDFARMRSLMDRLPTARRRVEIEFSRATKCTQQLSGLPSGSTHGDTLENSVIRYDEAKDALQKLLNELQAMRQEAEPCIDTLSDPFQRTVMKLRYLDGYNVQKIAIELHYSDRHIFRLLRQAEAEIG